jgi:mannose-1-phosphate guanylyltransferase
MNKNNFYCLIMAGGKGTRFWPESTEAKPKQYLTIFNEKSLLEETCDRFSGLIDENRRFVVTVKSQKELCKEATKNKINSIIFEPTGRNTGPCILLSLAKLQTSGVDLDSVVAIVPSDHVILNKNGFQNTLSKAAELAISLQEIVTIGITPNFPHTGFGYIEKGKIQNGESFSVSKFKEKPHFELAKEYVSSGNYLWNAGMFVAPLKVLIEEFKIHAPKMFSHFENLKTVINDEAKLFEEYQKIPSDSFDYAILEKSNKVSVVPATFDWNDLGSWDALTSVVPETHANTVVKSLGQEFMNSTGNIIYAPDKFVSLIDVKDHVVVVNDKVVLVTPISSSQEIKKVVEKLKISRPDLL